MIRKRFIKYTGIGLAFALAALFMPVHAEAAETSCTVTIPAEVSVDKTSAPAEEFTLVLEAEDENTPMPEKSEITVSGNKKAEFGPITYTVPDDYSYKVYQKAGTEKNFTYDKCVYTVTVRVVNDSEGGLGAEIWAIRDGAANKTDKISFSNKWTDPVKKTEPVKAQPAKKETVQKVAKTGDSQDLTGLAVTAAAAAVLAAAAVGVRRKGKR